MKASPVNDLKDGKQELIFLHVINFLFKIYQREK
jgi:hypothetical protein